MFAVFGFAAQASAATLDCSQDGSNIVCDYYAAGEGFSALGWIETDYPATPNGEPLDATGIDSIGTITDIGGCSIGGAHKNITLCDDQSPIDNNCQSNEVIITDDIQCSGGGGEEEGDCDGTGADLMLCTVVAGASGFFYDNAPAIILIGITIAIAFGFASWFIRRLRLQRKRF